MRKTCDCCGQDVASLGVIKNSHGGSLGLFGAGCSRHVRSLVNRLAAQHGAYIVDGRYLCSPRGTPDVRSLAALEAAVGASADERPRCQAG